MTLCPFEIWMKLLRETQAFIDDFECDDEAVNKCLRVIARGQRRLINQALAQEIEDVLLRNGIEMS